MATSYVFGQRVTYAYYTIYFQHENVIRMENRNQVVSIEKLRERRHLGTAYILFA